MKCILDRSKLSKSADEYYNLKAVPEQEQFLSKLPPLVVRNFVPREACAEFIEHNKDSKRVESKGPGPDEKAIGIRNPSYRNDTTVTGWHIDKIKDWYNMPRITEVINNYWGTTQSYNIIDEVNFLYSEYGIGTYCRGHTDVIIRNGKLIRPQRRLTSLLYLNSWKITPNEAENENGFCGGELIFPSLVDITGNRVHIRPQAGDLIIFPSTPLYVHAVSEITYGKRHGIVAFLKIDR
jgi:hypothetical protein